MSFLLTFWVLFTWEVDWYISAKTGAPLYRLLPLLAVILLGVAIKLKDREAVHWPLLIFLALHLLASFLAPNGGLARGGFKYMAYATALFVASVSMLDSAAKVIPVLKIYLLSFLWFGLQGLGTGGRVVWHPLLNNEDSYGPLMVLAMPIAFFFARGAATGTWRVLGWITFGVAALGLVASFARGAALAAGVTILYILFRSPRKLRSFAILIGSTVVLLPVVSSFVNMDKYVAEIASSGEGDDLRTTVWRMAYDVFKTSPVYGVGSGNFGVVASEMPNLKIKAGADVGLYYRAVHNPFFQILAEEGLIGTICFFTMIGSILLWTERLRRQAANDHWRQSGGGLFDLRLVALGLQGSTIAFCLTGIFYNQLYISWFWALFTVAFVLNRLSKASVAAPAVPAMPRARRGSRRG